MLWLPVSPGGIARIMFSLVAAMTVLSVAGHALQFFYGFDRFVEWVRLFNISGEGNIPTWFSSFGLVAAGLLFLLVARLRMAANEFEFNGHWLILGALFIYISIDETSVIHELAINPLQERLNTRGILLFAWVIPAMVFLFVFLAAYLRFLFHLPEKTRFLLLASGAVYVGGALGMELVSGYVADYHGDHVILRGGVATLEELLEMTGITLTIYTLMTHIRDYLPQFGVYMKKC